VFANESSHAALRHAWEDVCQWRVCHYTIMPDHIHLFCVPGVMHPECIEAWAGCWKRLAAIYDTRLKNMWLRDVWDTQMRSRDHCNEKRSYVAMNPVRGGHVSSPEEWPYSGSFQRIVW
jgi:putative transposase